MSTKTEIDFVHWPPDIAPAWTPSSLHDGRIERIEVDPRTRTVCLMVDVEYLRRFGELPEAVRFGIEISGVRSMRATRWRPPPVPLEKGAGEPSQEYSERVREWQALGQTVSADWDQMARTIAAHGMDVQDGAMLISDDGAALRLSGQVGNDEAWATSTWVVIEIAGRAIRWTRSDGVAWSAEELDALSERYWDDFAARGERLERARVYPHVPRWSPEYMAQVSAAALERHLTELDALPENAAASGIDETVLTTLAPELVYVRDHPGWRAHRDEVLAELARRGPDVGPR